MVRIHKPPVDSSRPVSANTGRSPKASRMGQNIGSWRLAGQQPRSASRNASMRSKSSSRLPDSGTVTNRCPPSQAGDDRRGKKCKSVAWVLDGPCVNAAIP